jgi:hypothetical protein
LTQQKIREGANEKAAFEAVKVYMNENNKAIQDLNVQQLKALVK